MNKGEKPMLPLWLSPTHIRFIPVSDEFISDCEKYVVELKNMSEYLCVRADIDDREQSVSRKIRDAEKEWTPVIVVVGDKEKSSKKFTPRFRSNNIGDNNKPYSLKDLFSTISGEVKQYPQEPIPLPVLLSKRPKFKG